MKKIIPIIMIILLSLKSYATDIPSVTFNENNKTFSFQNVGTYIDSDNIVVPDLFVNFKSVVPGDKLSQDINITVEGLNNDEIVEIYLKSQSENKDYTTLLESAELTVQNNEQDITDNLSDSVLLASLSQNGTINTNLILSIPTSAQNEVSNLSASVDWIFYARVIEDEIQTDYTPIPNTGYSSRIYLWVLIAISILAIIYKLNYEKNN